MFTDIEIKMSNDIFILGTLATGRDEYPTIGETKEPVMQMKGVNLRGESSIAFCIESRSYEPDTITSKMKLYNGSSDLNNIYVGVDTHHLNSEVSPFGNINPTMYMGLDIESRKECIYDTLEGKLALFKVSIKLDKNKPIFHRNVQLQAVLDTPSVDYTYACIPEIQLSNTIFEKKLMAGEDLYLRNYTHAMLPPEFIICGDYIYSNFQFKSWKKDSENYRIWSYDGKNNPIKKIKLQFAKEDYDNIVIRRAPSVNFIEENYLFDIISPLLDEGEFITADEGDETCVTFEENVEIVVDRNIKLGKYSKELEFLHKFKNHTLKRNLCYDMKDLINFHISVKTNPLTIVAGMSGTGKTQVSSAYASVLGLNEKNNNLLFLPISPSYTEPDDLIGYLNTTTGLYIASETGLVDFLIRAEKYPNQLHMVIFDEMNLSQVEHWFAPFISLLELPEEDRNLKLYSENSVCHNNTKYSNSVKIGNNIRFIGTVNLDETTKDFSDRLLDRANLVSLKKRSFKEFKTEKKVYAGIDMDSSIYLFDQYSQWINEDVSVENLTDSEVDLLDSLHDLISSNDPQKGVSFRIVEKIISYLENIPRDENEELLLSREHAFDIEIKQRVLTKIKGTERQFGKLIGRIDYDSGEILDSPLFELFDSDEAKAVSSFELTKEDIKRKSKELTIYGYAN